MRDSRSLVTTFPGTPIPLPVIIVRMWSGG
jgi:hypothetical protein